MFIDLTNESIASSNGHPLKDIAGAPQPSKAYLVAKRALDIVIAILGIVILSPLFAIIAMVIRLDSRGPVFYRQVRVGMDRVEFRMWKFRKMRADLATQGPMVTSRWDYRMTRVGRVLERLKLDELPQLFDVLRGTMSIVGPRPDVPQFVRYYSELWDVVLAVKPGIFGAGQNHFRNESELYEASDVDVEQFYVEQILPKKLELEIAYAHNACLRRDAALFLSGVYASLFGALTWQTIVTRRAQVGSFLVLSGIGLLGMMGAWQITEGTLALPGARWAILLAVVIKPATLLALRIPKALATSMTPDDFRRVVWAALGSAAVIVIVMSWRFGSGFSHEALALDTLFFLCAMVVYKLLLYTFHLTFFAHDASTVARSLLWAVAVAAPLSAATAVTLLRGRAAWTSDYAGDLAMFVALSFVMRPVMLLLLRPIRSTSSNLPWRVKGVLRIAMASIVGSTIVLMVTAASQQSRPMLDIIALDTLFFTGALLGYASWRRVHQGALVEDDRVDSSRNPAQLLLAGSGLELSSYVAMLDTLPDTGHELIGVVTPLRSQRTSTIGSTLILGGLVDLAGIMTNTQVDLIVLIRSSLDDDECAEVERCANEFSADLFTVRLIPDLTSRKLDATQIKPLPVPVAEVSGGVRD